MACVNSPRVEALVQHCPHTEEDGDSDIEFVCQETGTQLQYHPILSAVAQLLRERLEEQHTGSCVTESLTLGPPCKTVNVDGDGNCLFRAISKAFCGTDEYHLTLRQAVVKQLESYAATYKNILRPDYKSVSEYIRKSRIQSPGTWGTEVEIQAAADVLGVSIYTYYLNRWIEYRCNGVQVSDQGIYLENIGLHYKTVVCVKDPYMKSCYKYCQVDMFGNGVTRELSPSPLWSADHEYNGNAAKEDYEHYSPSKEDYECDWDSAEEDCECDWDPAEEDYERDWDPDEEDYERDSDPVEEDCERDGDPDGEDAGQRQQMREKLSWSELNTSWGIFMEWLSERWWGPVSEEEVISFMNLDKRRPGDVVVAAPFGDSPGAVCSITIKTKNSVLSTDVVICGRFYRCVQLLPGKFSDPCKVIRHLVRGMKYVQLQPRSKTIPSNDMYFSATHVAEQLRSMMGMLPRIFWGTYRRAESSSRYEEMMLRLRMKSGKFTNPEMRKGEFLYPAAIMHCTGDVGFGYLFEVITDQGRKIVVTFDRLGFTVGNGSHFYEITSVLAYISSVERVVFVTVPRSWDSVRSPEPQTMETGETSNSH